MENVICTSCHKSKAIFHCGICQTAICKSCTEFLEPGSFSFLPEVPPDLTHGDYCTPCFDQHVAPAITDYEQLKARAKQVFVFFKHQGKITRLMSRSEHPIRIEGCADENETLLRLAFMAAKANFNAVIDIDLNSEKVRVHGYQTSKWRAVGIPTNVKEEKYNR